MDAGSTPEITMLGRELAAAMPRLDADEQRIAITLYSLLAEGEPVAAAELAQRAGVDANTVRRLLDQQAGVYFDDERRVIGFWGLALDEMPHRMEMDGHSVHAWCAWDTLFLPELLGRPVAIKSRCPTTGVAIDLSVNGLGVQNIRPPEAVLSFLRPDKPFDADTITHFCHFVHFFASQPAAEQWTSAHPDTFTLSIDDGFELGKLVNEAVFGAALGGRRS